MFANVIVRRRRWVLGIWLLLIGLGIAAATRLSDRMVGITRLEGSESAAVEDLLTERFESPTAQSLLLVVRGLPADGVTLLERLADDVGTVSGVRTVSSPLNVLDTLLVGTEPGSFIIVVGIDTRVAGADSIVAMLRRITSSATAEMQGHAPSLTLRWTGGAALAADLRSASARDSRRAELRALPLLLIVLLIAYRSVVAALVPLVLGALAISVGLGVALLLALKGAPSTLLGNVASILGLALGIDYSLLMVTRFREGLRRTTDPLAAATEAARNAGPTIALSGATVALGFAALLLVPIPAIRSIALGGVGVAAVAVALATTLLPAALAAIGRRIDRGRFGRAPSSVPSPFWYRLGAIVTAHPMLVLLVAGTPLVLLSLPTLRLSPATPEERWMPASMESARALDDLAAIGRSGVAATIPVLVDLPRPGPGSEEAWEAVATLARTLLDDQRVADVRSAPTIASTRGIPVDLFLTMAPPAVVRHLLSQDGAMARLDVVPADTVSAAEVAALVRSIRQLHVTPPRGDGVRALVGGTAAFQVDFEDAVNRALPWVVLSVIGSIFVALSIGFRSVMIPVKATLLNLLTVGAGLGALVLVFQDGHGAWLFGIDGALSGVFPGVPILAFCIVFGLSMDYEVFLVGRIAEVRRRGEVAGEREAIVEGLAQTGRVITFAASLMVIVFTAFAFGEYLPAAFLGFALAVAVLADVTLVRLAVGPALLTLAGRWNWWPGRSARGSANKAPSMPTPREDAVVS